MLIGLIVVVVGLVLYLMTAYNGLVRLKVQCDNAWSDIDVQLKRRYDLIPNIVETVKGYAAHEKGTLEAVVAARNQAMTAKGPAAKGEAEGLLTGALRQVFALAEAYPQLRAVESFTQLQNTLNEIEDSVQNARRYYNAVVRDFNTMIEQFPSNIVAGMGHFKEREFFQVSAAAATPTSIPDQKITGSTRPTSAPASARDGSTANAAGATTVATSAAAPSQAARSTIATIAGIARSITA